MNKDESTTSPPSSFSTSIGMFVAFLSHPDFAPWIGLFLRLGLAWALPYFLDDGRLLPGVSYTDIDYLVFTDAAQYLQSGQSPYDRHTYRYTPFLAALLAYSPSKEAGRYIFCIADAVCGWIILVMRRSQRRRQRQTDLNNSNNNNSDSNDDEDTDGLWIQVVDSLWWIYNPLAINICTRGSSESLMVLLPVLLTFWIATNHERCQTLKNNASSSSPSPSSSSSPTDDKDRTGGAHATMLQAFWTGLCHGLAIHSKLYPIIYTLSYMAYFATPPRTKVSYVTKNAQAYSSFPWTNPWKLYRLAKLWFYRLFLTSPFLPLIFLVTALITFITLTWLAVNIYGEIALQEGLLYHFSRVDHRHNYSMYWYWIYLARAKATDADTTTAMFVLSQTKNNVTTTAMGVPVPISSSLTTMGRLLLLPQAFLLAYSSLGIAPSPDRLGLALFVQTYMFVTHNKVITAQYFTWYLCLLPLCTGNMNLQCNNGVNQRRLIRALAVLGLSIVLWLGSAYCLEMRGMAVHRWVWIASVLYFFTNVNLFASILQSIPQQSPLVSSRADTIGKMKEKKSN